jgi:hypothetical protein
LAKIHICRGEINHENIIRTRRIMDRERELKEKIY